MRIAPNNNNFAGQTASLTLLRCTALQRFRFLPGLSICQGSLSNVPDQRSPPFLDDNGRVVRIMMNAELVKAGESKIIIPTVYRDDYMSALRNLTRSRRCHLYSHPPQRRRIQRNDLRHNFNSTQQLLEKSNAFLEHTEGKLRVV